MRILQAMAGAKNGGAEGFFERLAGGFHRAGIEQKIIIRKDQDRAARMAKEGVVVSQLPFGGMLDFCTPFALKKITRDWQPDIVMTWMNRASKQMPAGPYVNIARLGGYYDLKYYKKCDHLIGNTQGIVDYLVEEGWPADRAHYVPNFVDGTTAPAISRAEFSTPDDAPLLLTMGRLHTNKGFDVLLKSMVDLPDCYLWIAGEGPERAALESLAQKLGVWDRIRLLGWQQDIAALLATCDVYVCPSRHEPLGNVVIEAWAHHKPIAASASQGPVSLIRHGENGMLAPLEDASKLAGNIQAIIADKAMAGRLAQAAYADYQAHFCEQVVVKQYLEFFKTLLDKK